MSLPEALRQQECLQFAFEDTEMRAAINFFFPERKVTATDIQQTSCDNFEDSLTSYPTVETWGAKFENGNSGTKDDSRERFPSHHT